MIVIADTTPINYLILIGKAELLTAVYMERLLFRKPCSTNFWRNGPRIP
jgi:hypothetical protein